MVCGAVTMGRQLADTPGDGKLLEALDASY
jgi:hypothetical protein